MSLEIGLSGEFAWTVAESDLATAQGSGDVPVLGTPRAIALCEAATLVALAGHLAPGETSVGTRVELDHLAASSPGARVTASAILREIKGRVLSFDVTLHDGTNLAARGHVRRAIVDRVRFLAGSSKS
jgi:predicted thioesterase